MFTHVGKRTPAALALTAWGLVIGCATAHAQGVNPDSDTSVGASSVKSAPTNDKINLELESTNLYYALKLLFAQIKANYVLEEGLKGLTVTAHLTNVPFRVALETLLKSTNVPLTYVVDNGIYNIKPKVEEAPLSLPDGPGATPERPRLGDGSQIRKIQSASLSYNAIDIVQAFGGKVLTIGNVGQYGNGGLGGGQGGNGLGGLGGGGLGGFGNNSGGLGGLGGGGLGGFGNSSGGFGSGSRGGRGF